MRAPGSGQRWQKQVTTTEDGCYQAHLLRLAMPTETAGSRWSKRQGEGRRVSTLPHREAATAPGLEYNSSRETTPQSHSSMSPVLGRDRLHRQEVMEPTESDPKIRSH